MKKGIFNYISIKHFCIGISLCCTIAGTHAAPDLSALNKTYDVQLSFNNSTVKSVVNSLKKQTDVVFSYDTSLGNVAVNSVSVNVENENLENILAQVFKGTDIEYRVDGQMVVLYSNKQAEIARTSAKQQSLKTVTGIIVDEFGDVVIGANVFVKGTTNGTITGLDGDFSLDVPEDAILVISYIGYSQQEVSVAGRTVLNISLSEDTQKLDEVVVTALGIKRQARSIGYSTTLIGGDDFTEARDINIGNALSGKVAGVSVAGNATGLGGSSRVVIRGNASLTGNNQPLYVIDGIPFDNTNHGNAGRWGGMDMGDGLNAINPDDIAEIQVLKGAAASALYGYRGGNGAILITTKSGSAQKGVSVEVNNNLTFNTVYDYRDFQTVYGQGRYGSKPTTQEDAYESYNSSWGAKMDGSQAVNAFGNSYAYNYVDNWKNFYRTGISDQASVAISGKGDNISYRFGISNTLDKSILPNSGLNQQGINMNTTYDITPKLHLTVNANYTFEKVKNRANLSDGNGNVNATLLYLANSYDVRWLKPGADEDGKEIKPGNNNYFNNPYWLLYNDKNETNKQRLTGAMTLRYDIFDWLYAQGQVTRDGYNLEFLKMRPAGSITDESGAIEEYSRNFSEINLNYLIGFNKKFGKFSINATLGGNRQRNITQSWGTEGSRHGFMVNGNNSSSNITTSNRLYKKSYSEYQVNSVYGTADFGYRDFLFLNFTGRNDWFSTLAPDSNSYFYPSVSASFVFSEAFILPEWIYTGKLRASYAQASNGTSPYMNALTYKTKDWTLQGQDIGTINNSTVPNAFLKPVSISEWEIGLSMQFLENRLGFDMAVYQKTTTDDIVQVSTSTASGFGSSIQNIGEIQNRGIELMINAAPIRSKDFTWRSTFNIAYNDSEVKYLGEGRTYMEIDGAEARSGDAKIQNIVGQPYGQIVGYKYERDTDGNIVYENGAPQRKKEAEVLGNGVYKLTGGFRNDFSYKNFSLGLLLDYKFGAKIFSGTNLNLYSTGLHKNTLEYRETGFTAPDNTKVDAQTYWQSITTNSITEEFVYNASFIKLRELSFGYTLPTYLLSKTPIKSVQLALVGRNLWTIMKHTPNIDPESAYNNGNGQGLELNGYPVTRNIGFNVNVKF